MLQPVEEMIFDSNSTERYKNIFRHETELKWIKLLQTPFPLGFNDNIYHQGNISKMPDFDVFSLLDIRRRNRRSRGKRKNGNLKRKHKNKTFWTLSDLCITKTSPCNEGPLTPHFYIVKLGFTGVYIFSYFCSKT